jgi:formimidoylglutamate deiminase
MTQYRADAALLPDGMAGNVRIILDAAGQIQSVTPDAAPDAADVHLDGIVLPGLPNIHGHAFQRAMAGLAERRTREGDSFWSWRRQMYRLVQAVTPDQVEAIAAQTYVEMLQAGYTHAVEFHYLHNQPDGTPYADPLEMANRVRMARESAGIGLTLLPTLYRFGGFGERPPEAAQQRFVTEPDAFIRRLARLHASARDDARTTVGTALHSLRAVAANDPQIVSDSAATIAADMPIHIHVAEQTAEVEACQAAYGRPPVAFLLDNAPVDSRWCIIHGTHMDTSEIRDLAATGAVAGVCPTTEANLGDGVFQLDAFRDAGGRFAIGSDSHVVVDPRAELRLLEDTARLAVRARNVHATPEQPHTGLALYQAALDGGADASGVPIGRLAPGYRADLLVLDAAHPSLCAASGGAAVDAWIFTQHGSPLRDVAVAGQWLVRDGRHVAADAVADRYRAAVRALEL